MSNPTAGILTDQDIKAEIEAGRLIRLGLIENIEACSYDLRAGTIFKRGKIIKKDEDYVVLEPGDIISLFTLEEVLLPADIAATVFPINSMSSQGLLVLNPGHIDPGFSGPITVRAINLRSTPQTIDIGIPIFTIIFERLPKAVGKPYNERHTLATNRSANEKAFKSTDVQQNPLSMGRLVMLGKDRPLMTGDEVDRRIRDHWSTKATLVGTLAGLLLAGIAAIFAIIGVYKVEAPKTNQQNVNTSLALPSPSSETSQNSNAIPTVKNDKISNRNQ
jgi:deoxycytidine triphosphate deaminase